MLILLRVYRCWSLSWTKRVKGYLPIFVVTPGVVTPGVPDGVLVCLALGVGLTILPGEPFKEVQIVQFQLSF